LLLALGCAVSGCATFQPRPIVAREILRDLQRVRLDALGPLPSTGRPDGRRPSSTWLTVYQRMNRWRSRCS
jgi:hypothetical protein